MYIYTCIYIYVFLYLDRGPRTRAKTRAEGRNGKGRAREPTSSGVGRGLVGREGWGTTDSRRMFSSSTCLLFVMLVLSCGKSRCPAPSEAATPFLKVALGIFYKVWATPPSVLLHLFRGMLIIHLQNSPPPPRNTPAPLSGLALSNRGGKALKGGHIKCLLEEIIPSRPRYLGKGIVRACRAGVQCLFP